MNESNNNENVFGQIRNWMNKSPGKSIGLICGFIIGIILFTFGIVQTLFIVIIAIIGYLIGKSMDENISIIDLFKNLFKKKNDK